MNAVGNALGADACLSSSNQSQMTAMLAFHGFSRGTFIGHSYGTSWLSYVCKYAPSAVAALLFLDPICFCLHNPRLTTSFVYRRPDPGTIAFTIRTDMMVNWTIQRAFPWAWISLYLDQIHVPCTVFVGDKDALVPSEKVEEYFRANKVPIADATTVPRSFSMMRTPISRRAFGEVDTTGSSQILLTLYQILLLHAPV